jgi:NADPH-dependent curcumin reductase CurA
MAERDTYMPPIPLGDVMRGLGVGVIVESNNAALPPESPVYGAFGWQDYAVVGPQDLVVPLPNYPKIPLTMHLGLFGHVGMTAYFGLIDVAKPQRGETLVVSGAAGAVGSLAGQIGKILGCRVVGITGAADKCQWLVDGLGFDAAVNYREEPSLGDALKRHCPDGIDVYFDNVGGHALEAVLGLINLRARIALCGMISTYERTTPGHAPAGPRNLFEVIVKRARMEGFLVLDFWNRASEAVEALARWHGEGRLKYRIHVVEGLEQAPAALNMLFDGTNRGKLIVQL